MGMAECDFCGASIVIHQVIAPNALETWLSDCEQTHVLSVEVDEGHECEWGCRCELCDGVTEIRNSDPEPSCGWAGYRVTTAATITTADAEGNVSPMEPGNGSHFPICPDCLKAALRRQARDSIQLARAAVERIPTTTIRRPKIISLLDESFDDLAVGS